MVALKVLLLPASLSQDERLQRVAVMEAAVSSGLSHPNLVRGMGLGPHVGATGCTVVIPRMSLLHLGWS